jgi:alkylation response protein AidB-like acyl-CoA dehydrogenase
MTIGFNLSREQEELQKLAKEFAEKELAPVAAEIDETDVFPRELLRKMGSPPYDFLSIPIPKQYGGKGLGVLATCLVNEVLAAVCATSVVLMEMSHLAPTFLAHASEEDRDRYLPKIARGEGVGAFAQTEPGAGSDPKSLNTKAVLDGDEWVINGRKRYVSFGHEAIHLVVMARTVKGVSAFLVDGKTKGINIVERVSCIGLRGHQDEEIEFRNCRIPKQRLLGIEGKGLHISLGTLTETRTTLCAGFVGLATGALNAAIKYAKVRESFGKPIAEHQAIRFSLSEMATGIEAARLLTYKAAWLIDNGQTSRKATSMAKVLASDVVLKATNLGVHVHGGFGCTKRFPVERFFRDARIWVFAQGSPEIQKEIVAREILKDEDREAG